MIHHVPMGAARLAASRSFPLYQQLQAEHLCLADVVGGKSGLPPNINYGYHQSQLNKIPGQSSKCKG